MLRPYSLLPKRPVSEACWLEESITGQVFLCFFNVSRSVLAKPKLPCMNSSWFCGRFTPARLNTKSAFLQYSSNCSGVESKSYSNTSSIFSSGNLLSLPSCILRRLAQRFLPTKPFAPVINIRIFFLLFLKHRKTLKSRKLYIEHGLHESDGWFYVDDSSIQNCFVTMSTIHLHKIFSFFSSFLMFTEFL